MLCRKPAFFSVISMSSAVSRSWARLIKKVYEITHRWGAATHSNTLYLLQVQKNAGHALTAAPYGSNLYLVGNFPTTKVLLGNYKVGHEEGALAPSGTYSISRKS